MVPTKAKLEPAVATRETTCQCRWEKLSVSCWEVR